MMIDTEIRISGEAANEFHNMMTSIDLDAISARDAFLSDVCCEFDEQGILSIDISDLNIDLGILDTESGAIEAIPVSKEEKYVGEVSIQFLSSLNQTNVNIINESKASYTVDGYYASANVYSVNQSVSIMYAA